MNGYTKLFGSILASTIWGESKETKVLWITMLAMADKYGEVQSSIPGLATIARLTIEETEESLNRLLSPDKYSRTKDFDGRRIKAVDGGWCLLNHGKYREKLDAEDRKIKNAEHQRQTRERKKASEDVRECQRMSENVSTVSTSEAASESESASKKEKEDFSLPASSILKGHDPAAHDGSEWRSLPVGLSKEDQAKADRLMLMTPLNKWVDQFIAAYPKKVKPNDVDEALEVEMVNLRDRHGWDDQRCVDHLLAKAAEYGASKFVATSPRTGIPAPAAWLKSGGYAEDPAEWGVDVWEKSRGLSGHPPKPRVSAPDPSKVLQTRRTTENPPLTPARPHLNLGDELLAQLSQDAPF